MEASAVKRCFIRFYGLNSLGRALAKTRKLIRKFPEIKIIGTCENKKGVVRIILYIPEGFIYAISRIPGVSLLIVEVDNCSRTDFWVNRIAGRIKLFSS